MILFAVITLTLFSLIGCQTVPRHLVREEVVIIYYEPIYVDPPNYLEPPIFDPPTKVVTRPVTNNPTPPRDLQSDQLKDGESYGKRDQLSGDKNRNPGENKTYPPVRKSEQNDRVQ